MELNINRDDPTTNDYITIHQKYGSLPNKIFIHDTFNGTKFESIINDYKNEDGIFNSVSEYIPKGEDYSINKKILIELSDDIFCSYLGVDITSEEFFIEEVVFYYKNGDTEEVTQDIIASIINHIAESEEQIVSRINSLTIDSGTLDIQPVHCEEIDIKPNCNKETYKKINSLIDSINKTENGISILHGQRGTGKTKTINYITHKANKTSIFIPINMIDISINSPEFKDFLKKYDHPLLIIDDLEFITNSQVAHMNYFTSNLMQLVDGFLSNNVQILLIINEENLKDLDKNLTSSNSLMDIIKFDKLNPKKSTKLSKNLGLNVKYKEKALLTEVYSGRTPKIIKIGL